MKSESHLNGPDCWIIYLWELVRWTQEMVVSNASGIRLVLSETLERTYKIITYESIKKVFSLCLVKVSDA